jgi:hypothetical protein
MVFAILVNGLVVLFVWRACASILRERRARKEWRGELRVSPRSGLAAGAMMLGFQEIVQPQVRHMLVEELKEESVDDEKDEPLGGRLFYEQMRRIRMGEEVEEVTVKIEGCVAGGETFT